MEFLDQYVITKLFEKVGTKLSTMFRTLIYH